MCYYLKARETFLLVKCAELVVQPKLVDGVFIFGAVEKEISEQKVRALAEISHLTSKLWKYTLIQSS